MKKGTLSDKQILESLLVFFFLLIAMPRPYNILLKVAIIVTLILLSFMLIKIYKNEKGA
ncbi:MULTISPECIES: hypothetical protein [Lactobacillus]|uniref:hypothetical protein n=1 Tax=Lactobacillus TaxID=1578 RepID=UPI0018DB033A|nr:MULTISPECIES: hypothetical protein [Lactobacillus]MCO6529777.1 hypothetical protein [Lactobacillus sp.]